MAKTITKKFKLSSLISVLSAVLLSNIFSIIGGLLSSDIMISGSGSAAVRFLPSGANYLGIFFSAAAVAFSIASVFYALTYFGRKTARRISLTAILCYFVGVAVSFTYAVISNEMSLARILAVALTLLIDVAYFAATLAAAWIICAVYLNRCTKKGKNITLVAPSVLVGVLMMIIRLADLTFSAVLPFILNNTVIASDIRVMIGDYIYYTAVYGILPIVLTLLSVMIYKKITGALVPKSQTKIKEKEN